VFHDIWPYSNPALAWGIYLDATCGGYLVENNLVYNTYSGGLMFNNGGHAHTIRNNIFALSARQALWPYSEKRPSTLRRNIVYLTQGELLIPTASGLNGSRPKPLATGTRICWHTARRWPVLSPQLLRWRSWPDRHSRIADPILTSQNMTSGSTRIAGDGPAEPSTFQVGLYGEPAGPPGSPCRLCLPSLLPTRTALVDDDFEKPPSIRPMPR
jgi:hypothetical protein